ncbi:MAG: permease-like cell division protein FtsX [Muribaculaceae bacterium]|nr:permease-like cell division protein FtsX [Muribaculaceae bacterium]
MAKRLHLRIPVFGTRATATISVALVLVILGLAAMVGMTAARASESVRESMGFVVVLTDNASATDIDAISSRLKTIGAVRKMTYSSSEAILEKWQRLVGDDEDILRLAGVNPFTPELEVSVTSDYANPDSITMLTTPISLMPNVSDVRVSGELIDTVSKTTKSISLTLIIIAAALLIVSFVLIFNTVRLTVYSRRFLINTMQLVGATRGFVMRPFLAENALNGLIAGILASGALAVVLYGASRMDPNIAEAIRPEDALTVMVGMILTGIIICFVGAWMACSRYLSLSFDELYK